MLEKTRGIILHQIKYSDSGIVVQMYTRKFGRQSLLIRGIRNKKTGKHSIIFQPMFILDIEMYFKASREMQSLKEFSVSHAPYEIYSNVMKSCVAMFLGEILTSVLREESPHQEMFDYIEESIVYFDGCKDNYSNFHIAFLAGLSGFLGFEPSLQTNTDESYFDLKNGIFVAVPPVHRNYADRDVSDILALFFASSFYSSGFISLNGILRNKVLETLVSYYSLHLPGLRNLKSLEVLKEVFR
jgi:DNA repair protein RecO (recombination protein O)